MKNATWSGRFKKSLDKEVLEFSESISVDHLLFDSDIKVCMAHAQMLCECKIITKSESNNKWSTLMLSENSSTSLSRPFLNLPDQVEFFTIFL